MPRSAHFDHGYVVGLLVSDRLDSPDDDDRLPDVVGATNVKPKFTRLQGQHKHPLRQPENGAYGMLVSPTPIPAAVMADGHITGDVDASGRPLPGAQAGIWLVAGVHKVDLGGPFGSFTIEVTTDHTETNPLDLYAASPYVPPIGATVQTVLLPANGLQGQVLSRAEDGALVWVEQTGGGSQGPSHASILASGNVTLPIEHPVLTIRATEPSTIAVADAPDGTVITVHVAEGWQHITWATGITVTGAASTSETWVVLVRSEGAWQVLVSGGAEVPGDPDTGVVDITGLTNDVEYYRWWGYSTVRRVGKTVYLSLSSVVKWPRSTPPPRPPMLILPAGYRPVEQIQTTLTRTNSRGLVSVSISTNGDVRTYEGAVELTDQEGLNAYLSYPTDDPWPA